MAKKKTATTEYKTIDDWLKRHPQKATMQRAFDELCRLFQQEDKQNPDWWYNVGRQALILYHIDDQRFGQNFIPKLAKETFARIQRIQLKPQAPPAEPKWQRKPRHGEPNYRRF